MLSKRQCLSSHRDGVLPLDPYRDLLSLTEIYGEIEPGIPVLAAGTGLIRSGPFPARPGGDQAVRAS